MDKAEILVSLAPMVGICSIVSSHEKDFFRGILLGMNVSLLLAAQIGIPWLRKTFNE